MKRDESGSNWRGCGIVVGRMDAFPVNINIDIDLTPHIGGPRCYDLCTTSLSRSLHTTSLPRLLDVSLTVASASIDEQVRAVTDST